MPHEYSPLQGQKDLLSGACARTEHPETRNETQQGTKRAAFSSQPCREDFFEPT
jgi:hypothetical protein